MKRPFRIALAVCALLVLAATAAVAGPKWPIDPGSVTASP